MIVLRIAGWKMLLVECRIRRKYRAIKRGSPLTVNRFCLPVVIDSLYFPIVMVSIILSN